MQYFWCCLRRARGKMHKESSVCGQLCTRLGFPATHLKYAQLVHAAPPQPSDLVRRRMAGASSRLLLLQIKPLIRPTALSRAQMSQRLGCGSRASELSCAEPRSFKEIAPERWWWQWGSLQMFFSKGKRERIAFRGDPAADGRDLLREHVDGSGRCHGQMRFLVLMQNSCPGFMVQVDLF